MDRLQIPNEVFMVERTKCVSDLPSWFQLNKYQLSQNTLIQRKHIMTDKISAVLTILRRKQVESRTGLSRSTIYSRIAEGTFPRPIDLGGGRAVGWIEAEINEWLKSRIEESRKIKGSNRVLD
jgi:prophage regulatory protein